MRKGAGWMLGLLGDLDDPGEETPGGERITLSIMRDLIRLRHPDLERPGAGTGGQTFNT